MSKELLAALSLLEKDNDDHWTQDGSPAVKAVETIGSFDTNRDAIMAVAPEFNRGNLTLPNASDKPESESTEPTESAKLIAEAEAELETANDELVTAQNKRSEAVKNLDALIVKEEKSVSRQSTADTIKAFQNSQTAQRSAHAVDVKEVAELLAKRQQGLT